MVKARGQSRSQLMTGSGHMEWIEGMPLAVRRYGIDQMKCKVLLCGAEVHRLSLWSDVASWIVLRR